MLVVNDRIKNAYNQYTTQRKSKIRVGNNEYFIQNMDLYADAYDEGNIVGNTIAKTLKFDIETQYVRGLDEFELLDGIWTGEEYEYVNLGTFKLFEEQGTDDFFSSITAYDKLILFNEVYNPIQTMYPTTIYGLLQNICEQAGVTLGTQSIANGDKILNGNVFVEGETLKDVLKAICQISGNFAVISNDTLKLKLQGEDNIVLNKYQLSKPEYKRTTWKVNQVVLGMQDIIGEYVLKQDDEDVELNGVHKIVINNNPFVYNQDLRQSYIDELFDAVKGFGYVAFETNFEGLPYIELGDSLTIDEYESLVLRYELKSPDGLNSMLQAPSIIDSVIDYVNNTDDIDNKQRRTEYRVNKAEGTITQLTQVTTDIKNDINNNYYTITQTNELVQNASTGITNTFSEAGGNNVFRNTGLWFGPDTTTEEKEASSTNGKIEIDDGADNTLSNLKIYGNTSQEGTPTPDTPVPVNVVTGDNTINICGKNLFNKNTITISAYLKEDGTLQTGTGAEYVTSDFIPVQPNTTYYKTQTLSPRTKFYDANKQVLDNSTYQDVSIGGNAGSFTTPNNAYYFRFTGYVNTSTGININTTMVHKGSEATTYEPYIGKSYPIYLGVENLWKNQLTGFLPQSGSYPTTSSTYPNARYILVNLLKGQSITLSGSTSSFGRVRYIDKDTNQVVGMINNRETEYYKSTGTYVWQFTEGTITAKKDFIVGIMDMGGAVNNLIVNYGTTPQTISDNPIELCKIGDYQDRIYKDNGKWYLNKQIGKYVISGNEETSIGGSNFATMYSNGNIARIFDITNMLSSNKREYTCSNNFSVVDYTLWNAPTIGIQCYKNAPRITISAPVSEIEEYYGSTLNVNNYATVYVNYLAHIGTYFLYVLATPTTEEITDSELINQLNSIKTIDGYNLILLASNDVDTEFDITYLIDFTSYEYWTGDLGKIKEEKAANLNALLLQHGEVYQEQQVPNGNYTISFKYKKLINLANVKCIINDVEYELTANDDTEFTQTIDVSTQHIRVTFTSDRQNACEIYDLMVNAGKVKLAYSQNQNETTTDTVNISKGITITSTDTDTTFKANADGIRTLDRNGNVLTKFTDTGMTTKEMIVEDTSQIVGVLVQQVGDQTWFTKL